VKHIVLLATLLAVSPAFAASPTALRCSFKEDQGGSGAPISFTMVLRINGDGTWNELSEDGQVPVSPVLQGPMPMVTTDVSYTLTVSETGNDVVTSWETIGIDRITGDASDNEIMFYHKLNRRTSTQFSGKCVHTDLLPKL
jgi:hypothetical protein